MKTLVTGANGFVGSYLVKRLVADERSIVSAVRVVPVLNSETNNDCLEYVEIPSLSQNTDWKSVLVDVNTVVHLAARVHVMREKEIDSMAAFRQVNVLGTLNLARQAAAAGVRRFIFISSIKVNGESSALGHPFTADDIAAPLNPYGVSKFEAEQGLRALSVDTGMEVVIIRPPLVYGAGVKANFESMLRWLKRGIPLPLGGITTNRRSLVYVENLVDLIRVCIEHPKAANQTFLVSDDDDVSTTMLLRRMAKALGCPARLVKLSPMLIKLISKLIAKPGIASRLCDSLQVDITKTNELLGWRPKFSLDEGLLRTAKPKATTLEI